MKASSAQIGEFAEVVSGPAFKSAYFTDDPSDVPLIKGENVAQGYIAWDKSKYWPANDTEGYERFGLGAGDIVLAMDRPWVTAGLKWARLKPHDPPSLLVQRVARLRAKPGLLQDYLTYVIGSAQFSQYVRNIMGGTNVPHISGAQIKAFKFRLPSENQQAAIANILSAHDDLIENNRRRIALLEEAARLLYREWFVHFRFPGHEHVKIINGLPEGWERRTLADVVEDISYGYTESASHDVDGPRFLRITDIVDGPIEWSSVPRCPISEDKLQRFLLTSDDIVVARTGATTGWARRVGRLSEPAVYASYLVRFRFGQRYRPEVGATFMQSDAYKAFVKGNLGGAAQPNASAKVLASAPCFVASNVIQTYFVENVAPMFEQIDVLMEQIRKLAQARDLLLPRLMNGEIAV